MKNSDPRVDAHIAKAAARLKVRNWKYENC